MSVLGVAARAAWAVAVLVVLVLVPVAPVEAHTRLTASTPADGARLARPPAEIRLRFSEPVDPAVVRLSLVDAAGRPHRLSEPHGLDGEVGTTLAPTGPAGRWRLDYRVVGTDGHPVTGTLSFTVGASSTEAGRAAPGGFTPSAGLLVGAAVLAVGGGALWLRRAASRDAVGS